MMTRGRFVINAICHTQSNYVICMLKKRDMQQTYFYWYDKTGENIFHNVVNVITNGNNEIKISEGLKQQTPKSFECLCNIRRNSFMRFSIRLYYE
jgi:hypothetical protein